MSKEKTILVVGSIAIDTLQTPMGNRKEVLGGSASYFSIAAGLLATVKVVGVVGNDYPNGAWKMFLSRGINMDNVQVAEGKTFQWGGKYSDDFSTRDTLFTDLGVFETFSPEIRENDCCSPLVFLGNIQPDLQLKVANMMVSPEYIISDTMNLWIDLFPKELNRVIKKSDIFLINHEEAQQYSGLSDILASAQMFLNMGPDTVVVKMGSNGSLLVQKNREVFVPVYPVKKLLDPTGAGDSFAGGFMGYLSRTDSPNFIDAVVFGSAMASFCVEGFGLEALLAVNPEVLNERVETIRNSMSDKVTI